MEEKNVYSIMDAFIALRDADDDIVMPTVKKSVKVDEGYTFDTRDSLAINKAEEVINEPKEEGTLEVIDANADTVKHLKDDDDYVGQFLLCCKACKAIKFANSDELVVNEEDDTLYNVDDECPHCHITGKGFELVGQVGKAAEDEPLPEIENDEVATDEETFEKIEDEEQVEEAPAAEEESSEEEFEFDSEEEPAYDETNAEDDTLDMEDNTGDEFDENDVAWDDTEEKEEISDEETETKSEEDEEEIKGSFVKSSSKNESLDGEEAKPTIEEILKFVVEPENIEEVLIRDVDRDSDDDAAVLYYGSFAELPHKFFERAVEAFSNGQNEVINILVSRDGDKFLGEVLSLVDKYAEAKINFWDDESHDLLFSDALDKLERPNSYFFKAFESPKFITFAVKAEEGDDRVEKAEKSDEDDLVEAIINSNNMRPLNLNDSTSNEYWINECVKNREDLDMIYEQFVVGDHKLEEQFTKVTGFMSQERKDQIINESMSGEDFSELVRVATDCGYTTFAEIADLMKEKNLSDKEVLAYLKDEQAKKQECVEEYHDEEKVEEPEAAEEKTIELDFTEEEVKDIAHEVAEEAAEKAVEEETKEEEVELSDETKEAVEDIADAVVDDKIEKKTLDDEAANEVTEELIGSYKTRKELAEAIEECKNNNKPYSVRRSATEGFRWDLLNKASEEACPECTRCEAEDNACCDDFDQLSFENDINDYFKDAYERPICFKADSHECCDDHSIKCCGKVCSGDVDTDIVFVLVPVLNEELGTIESYNVTNNLSDEEMIYTK